MRAETAERCWVIDLDDPAAIEDTTVGAKVAHLARARRAGLPVLPGIVLPVAESVPALRRAEEIAGQSGIAAARLALSAEVVGDAFELAASSRFGADPLVARSSSPLESGGNWSGAFSSYLEIAADELCTAVLGCWASMFARDASERFEALGLTRSDHGMAVLAQPYVAPQPGGVSVVDGDGVHVTVAAKSLPGMLLGWERGIGGVVRNGGRPEGPAAEEYGASLLLEVAGVAAGCAEATGDDHLEWALVDGRVVVLQCRRLERPSPRPRPGRRSRPDGTLLPASDHCAVAARLIARYSGPAGEALVLPWALAPGGGGRGRAPVGPAVPPESLAAATVVAERLAGRAWGTDGARAVAEAGTALQLLRTRLDMGALEQLSPLDPADHLDGRRLLAGLEMLGARLVICGVLADCSDLWRLSLADLAAHLGGTAAGTKVRRRPVCPDPWEPFLLESISANGTLTTGTPASAGSGAGRALHLAEPRRLTGALQRHVLCIPGPHPGFAPLLWGAAGVVSAGGSAGAHLFDVARSLGVPAVAGCEDPGGRPGAHVAAAVDGSSGDVAWI